MNHASHFAATATQEFRWFARTANSSAAASTQKRSRLHFRYCWRIPHAAIGVANNIAKADVLDASRGLPASQSLILVTLIVATVATRYRLAFATLTDRERRRLQVRTSCEIVPSILARRLYSARYSCDIRC